MRTMNTRLSPVFAVLVASVGLAAVVPATASAQPVELGQTSTPIVRPVCTKGTSLASCKIVLARTTAVETASDAVINPVRVNRQGWVVAFSIGLSRLVPKAKQRASIIKNLDSEFGGPPQLQISVLKPGKNNSYTVTATSGTYQLLPFLGQVIEEPLSVPPKFTTFTALPVVRGDVIGITVPTWAPVLTYNLAATQFSYRQSRRANCINPAANNTAQTKVGDSADYHCYYTGTRVEYTATEITDTKAPHK